MQFDVALLGFGNVGRSLAELIARKAETLRETYDLDVRVVGISTGSHGKLVNPNGIDVEAALDAWKAGGSLADLPGQAVESNEQFIDECPAALVFESIPTNPQDGQPALGYARAILSRGVHYVTANKGPVAFGYRELREVARQHDVGFFFESTVMDGAPVLAVGREGLPAAHIDRIQGIFNSTTNYILTRMEDEGMTFDEALAAAQEIGIAETDPTLDIDGWDASIKTVILANVIMGADLRPTDVDREGIRGLALSEVQQAAANGERIRLLCEAERTASGEVKAAVKPQRVPVGDILASIKGTTSIVDFETDVLPRLTIVENDPGPMTTAYGMLADMINIARGRFRDGTR